MKKIGGITKTRTHEDDFHARVQALRSRNARQDESALEILVMLSALAALFIATF